MTRSRGVVAGAKNSKAAIVNIRNIKTILEQEKLTHISEVRLGRYSLNLGVGIVVFGSRLDKTTIEARRCEAGIACGMNHSRNGIGNWNGTRNWNGIGNWNGTRNRNGIGNWNRIYRS